VLAVTVDGASGQVRTRRLPGATSEVVAFCASLPGLTKVAYEARPTCYGLARALHAAGIGCVVAAPGKIERPTQDRVKTDQRDGERVLRLLIDTGLAVYFAIRKAPGSVAPTRTPTGCYVNTSRRAPTSPATARMTSPPSPRPSTAVPARPSAGEPPPKSWTST
jgi:hypothetical protein